MSNELTAQINIFDNLIGDWVPVLNDASNSAKSFSRDANSSNDTQFTQGSQDPDYIADWGWEFGNTNDKGDISNAGAALIGETLYFFSDRTAINGDASIGFWFFQNRVSRNPDGTFSGTHTVGDILVLSNFTNGGGNSDLLIYTWIGDVPGGPLKFERTTTNAHVNTIPIVIPSEGPFDASRNGGLVNGDMWTYQGKNVPSVGTPSPNNYHTGAFFEGFVNLSAISDKCFTTFMVETRNSQSINAALQDFVMDEFGGIPSAPVTSPMEYCMGEIASQLSATGSNLLWYDSIIDSTGDTTAPTPNTSVAGVYDFYVSQSTDRGCESERALLRVTVNPKPSCSISSSTDPSCNGGSDGSLTSVGSGGTAPYSYSLNGGTSQADGTFSGLSANVLYTIEVTDAKGCKSTCSKTLTQPNSLSCSISSSTDPSCNGGSDGSLTSAGSGGTTPYSYSLNGGISQASGTFSGLSANVLYTIEVTDAKGCKTTCSVTLNQPNSLSCSITINNNDTCAEGADGSATVVATGGTAPYSYVWDNGETLATAVALGPGPHSVVVTDKNGCKTTCETTVMVDDCMQCETVFGYNSNYSSCFLQDQIPNNRWGWTNLISGEGTYSFNLYEGAAQCDISKGILAGTATVVYSGGQVTVTYNMNPGYVLSEIHVYIGKEKYPRKNGKITVAPGQYNINPDLGGNYVSTYQIGPVPITAPFYVILHGVSCSSSSIPVLAKESIIETDPAVLQDIKNQNISVSPNPFINEINVKYSYNFDTDVRIEIRDLNGILIKTIHDKNYKKGSISEVNVNLVKYLDRLLFVKVTSNQGSVVKKIISTNRR
ncbi:Ig-like domain-containing protein [Gelidibacter salicanalis]|nr:hypothetical protein [Gelidibacter salicanalis]